MVVYDKKYAGKPTLKKRGWIRNRTPQLHFGDTGIFLKNALRFEFPYLFFMRKFIKKCLKTRKRFYKKCKIWVFLRPNHVLSKKAKNARMGKGKGNFIRWCAVLPKGFTLVEFFGISHIRIRKYMVRLERKFKIPLALMVRSPHFTKFLQKRYLGSDVTAAVTRHNYRLYI